MHRGQEKNIRYVLDVGRIIQLMVEGAAVDMGHQNENARMFLLLDEVWKLFI